VGEYTVNKSTQVFFAGEYTAKENHGWMQAAVTSACRVAFDMFSKSEK